MNTKQRNEKRYYIALTVFVLAVLIPCFIMSALAIRSAEREAAYVERRMETSLLAEVDLTSAGIDKMMTGVLESLRRDAFEQGWNGNPLVGTLYSISAGQLDISGDDDEVPVFRANFEGFLLGKERLPTYELVTRLYKAPEESAMLTVSRTETSSQRRAYSRPSASVGMTRQKNIAFLETAPDAEDMIFEQTEREGFLTHSRNVAPQKSQSSQQSQGASRMAPSPVAQSKTLDYTSSLQTLRSRTVSKYRYFNELSMEADYGILPNITSDGLQLLFWAKAAEDGYSGCTLRMEVLLDMIADIMPDVISDARILTVLDESGYPIVIPEGSLSTSAAAPDWASPFVAREISHLLPRWEVGAWLADPTAPEARGNFARMLALIQVAALGVVMLAGSAVVIRMMSYEMRVASQKTTFIANVSHELKTPLTSIRLYAELLASGKQNDELRRREYLRTMVSETERLSNLVDNVLTFSKRDKGAKKDLKSESVSLADLAQETVAQIEPHLEKLGFLVTCASAGGADGKTEELLVKGDREALKQVLVNLLSNAEKYSGASREIDIEFGRFDFSANKAEVRVMDRGIGIPQNMSEKIFQEFVRGDNSLSAPAGGTGLGLFIARDIARAHGGDVSFSKRDGGGSIFTLSLPLATSDFHMTEEFSLR